MLATSKNVLKMSFHGGVRGCQGNKQLHFGGDPNHHVDCPVGNLAITQQIMNRF